MALPGSDPARGTAPAPPAPRPGEVTGLILAGGRGARMAGADKGLVAWQGLPLIEHVRRRLAPAVGTLLVSANRNAEAYARYGKVVADEPGLDGFQGPLAGVAAGLAGLGTPWLAVAPCDTPLLPADMVARLLEGALAAGAPLAVADAGGRWQPVCMVLRAGLRADLLAYLQGGGRRVDAWQRRAGAVAVPFDDPRAFFNVNTLDDLERGDAPAPAG